MRAANNGAAGAVAEDLLYAQLLHTVVEKRLALAPTTIANLYIALKSKPFAILVGLEGCGKIDLVDSFADVLIGRDSIQYQRMVGHARWAAGSQHGSQFTQAQTRLNASKLLALIEEAYYPGNQKNVYIACLMHMSPAEVNSYFAALAFQLQHGHIMRVPGIHLNQPVPFPKNLFLLGTIDTEQFNWFETDVFSHTTVIRCQKAPQPLSVNMIPTDVNSDIGHSFLEFSVRNSREALAKLLLTPGWHAAHTQPLLDTIRILREHGASIKNSIVQEVYVFLANAWTEEHQGLFDQSFSTNLAMALDMAAAQIILPRGWPQINTSGALCDDLLSILNPHLFPNSRAFLNDCRPTSSP